MRLPGTLDPRRLRSGARATDADDEYEYEYVEVDADGSDAADLDDEWEWVEVEVDEDDDAGIEPRSPSATGRGRRLGRFVANLLPLAEADEADDDGDGGGDDAAEADTTAAVAPAGSPRRRERLVPVDRAALDGPDRGADDGAADDEWWEGGLDDDGQPLVDPRIAARRDGVAQARRTRLRRRLVALAVVVAVLLGMGALTRSAVLDVDEIVVGGVEHADAAAIVAASGITAGTPLLGLDLDQALRGIQDEPWVLDATIDRAWSGTISISVVERQPVATVNAGDGGWLSVDRDGRVVAAALEQPSLPVVDGVGVAAVGEELGTDARAAIDVAASLTPGLRTRVAVVNGADPGAIELTLQPSGTVRFGPATQVDERIRSLQAVFAQVDLVCLQTIDLRVPDAPVLTRVPACA